jgi:hypothetical protein
MASRQKRARDARELEYGPRTIPGIPGTVEPATKDWPITEIPFSQPERRTFYQMNRVWPEDVDLRRYRMGDCNILVGHEPAGPDHELLWHLTISTRHRHPTWDEIKIARYRLLPLYLTFAMFLPPPDEYINVPVQDHVMQLWETTKGAP